MLKKYALLFLVLIGLPLLSQAQSAVENPDPHRFEAEIVAFNQWDQKNSFPQEAILFVGSSSIRMWQTHQAFPDFPVINRGFGGAQISDILYYYDDVIAPYHPEVMVFYCGDNDIAAGKPVAQVFADYKKLIGKILQDNPDVQFIYLPAKPSSSRWEQWGEKMAELNQTIQDYNNRHEQLFYVDTASPLLGPDGTPNDALFLDDHLHLNKKGYEAWNNVLESKLAKLYSQAVKQP